MSAVRAPQSNPARMALLMLSASIKATRSMASAAGWPLWSLCSERNRVLP